MTANDLNRMCRDCASLGESCDGTTCHTWTGCVFRKSKVVIDYSYMPVMSREDLKDKGVLISALHQKERRV